MKILPFEQGSDEWLEFRKGRIGASDIATIMCGTEREIYDLYQEKVEGKDRFVNDAMKRGSIMEEEAILWLLGSRLKIERPVCMHEDCDWLIASLDAYHAKRKLMVEIKCPTRVPDVIEDYPRYMRAFWQLQAQMYVTGLQEAVLLVYGPLKSLKQTIQRNDEAISKLLEKGHEFYHRMILKNPPTKPAERVVKEDEETVCWARLFKEIDEKIKPLEEAKKELRERGIEMADDEPFECEGVVVTKIKAKETIDYEAACKAHGIDASRFKKAPKSDYTWRVQAS